MRKHRIIILIAVWILAVGLGLHGLMIYKGKAGDPGLPPAIWVPNELVSLSPAKPLLLMFAHPRCPCTKASLEELDQLVTAAENKFDVTVVFFEPNNGSADWSNASLIREARGIRGVHVLFDKNGHLARRFHVATSGHTLVYDATGNLLFTGGITSSRGHLGDNAGFVAVKEILLTHTVPINRTTTPVFGCELFDPCTRNQIANHR